MKIHINKLDLMVIFLWIAIFPFYTSHTNIFYVYQFLVALIVAIFTLYESQKIPGKFFLFLYPFAIIISCLVNRASILRTNMARGCINALIIIDLFTLFHKYIRIKGTVKLFRVLYKMSQLYFLISVLWISVLIIMKRLEDAIQDEFLFLGGKFATAYMLIFYLMFFCIAWNGNRFFSKKRKKLLFLSLSLFCIAICSLIHSMTGVVAITLFLIIMLIPKTILKFVSNPAILVGLIIGSMILVFSLSIILSLPLVQNLITNILHKDLSLTGRMQLYELLYPLVFKSGFWGKGYGSYVANQLGYHGWYNAQNGLSEIILTYGYCGAGAFLAMAFSASLYNHSHIKPLTAAIFVFIIVAIVEIPFNLGFILLLVLFMFSDIEIVEMGSKFSKHIAFSLK